MNTFLSTLVLLAALTQSSHSAASEPLYQQSPSRTVPRSASSQTALAQEKEAVAALAQQAAASQQILDALVSRSDPFASEQPLWDRAHEAVLVIPTPELPAESWVELTEDLTVMCRIFDKALPASPATYSLYRQERDALSTYRVTRPTPGTQGLYLDGYGVLFFLQVDYPLVPTPQQAQPEVQPQEQGDPVWAQTIQEMSGRQASTGEAGRSGATYDPQKVESLKRTLLKTLAHAANIRTPRPQDLITLVAGPLDDRMEHHYLRGPRLSYSLSETNLRRDSRGAGVARSSGTEIAAASAAPGVMILHVAKSDVDACAKGLLTLPQFTEKVQTLWIWPNGTVSKDNKPPTVSTPAPSR